MIVFLPYLPSHRTVLPLVSQAISGSRLWCFSDREDKQTCVQSISSFILSETAVPREQRGMPQRF